MNPLYKHFWVHSWGKWSEPFVVKMLRDDGFKFVEYHQRRMCKVCGKVEERDV